MKMKTDKTAVQCVVEVTWPSQDSSLHTHKMPEDGKAVKPTRVEQHTPSVSFLDGGGGVSANGFLTETRAPGRLISVQAPL